MQKGLKEQIVAAVDANEVDRLLALAKSYTNIHPATLRKCEREAAKKKKLLKA